MAKVCRVILVLAVICCVKSQEGPPDLYHGVDLPTKRPLNIAHRGASGILPEQTVEAFRKAIEQGADVIECDVCVTKDLKFVCLHDSWLNATTDVASKFPEYRIRTYYIPEMRDNITDYFSVDFTLAELKTLRVKQAFEFRDQSHNFKYPIATLDEAIEVIKKADRPVGFYPELKDSDWVNELDIIKSTKTFEEHLVESLEEHGYSKSTDPCFVQSFQYDVMLHLKNLTDLPLVILMWRGDISIADLDKWKQFYAIGPWKEQLVRRFPNNTLAEPNNIIEEAHARGLRVHTYTFRNENQYLAFEYGQDPYAEYEKFRKLGIDGFFTDFPLTFHNYLENVYRRPLPPPKCPSSASRMNVPFLGLATVLLWSVYQKFIYLI